ncbi:MAG: HAD-IC family P-type ATPase, partial [Cellulosilyticaceae bacterium]
MKNNSNQFINKKILKGAIKDSFLKLSPKVQVKNPVMFIVYIGSIMTTVLYGLALCGVADQSLGFIFGIALLLWFTVLFANFAEAIAEGRGKAQAESLRKAKKDVQANRLSQPTFNSEKEVVLSSTLKKGNYVLVVAGEQIPADGEVVEGAASVDESAITGESAPVIRESGGDRSAVTGGTTVTSDWLIVQVTAEAGESFLDKMIAMVEGASRKKTPNEIALQILLVTLTIIFLVVTATLYPFSDFAVAQNNRGSVVSITSLIALLVCLAPTTIGALLSSIGI